MVNDREVTETGVEDRLTINPPAFLGECPRMLAAYGIRNPRTYGSSDSLQSLGPMVVGRLARPLGREWVRCGESTISRGRTIATGMLASRRIRGVDGKREAEA